MTDQPTTDPLDSGDFSTDEAAYDRTPVPPGLTRVTANLTPNATRALDVAVRATGDSPTDVICLALMVYAAAATIGATEAITVNLTPSDAVTIIRAAPLRADIATVLAQRIPHSHSRPGIWDDDNRPGIAGTRCVECAARGRLLALVDEGPSLANGGRLEPGDETRCHRCGGPNVLSWSAPSPLWNAVMRGGSINGDEIHDGIVCPTCFAQLAKERGIADLWRFYADRVLVPLETVTPSGRVFDEQTWKWRNPDATPTDGSPT